MGKSLASYPIVLAGTVGVAWITSTLFAAIGPASAALLFLVPVLYGSVRGGLGPGLLAAMSGAAAYNYFLLAPRFTFHVSGAADLVSVFVLVAVALVTSQLATRLKAREREALQRAEASEELARLSTQLAAGPPEEALSAGLAWLERRYGRLILLTASVLPEDDAGFSSVDFAAAAWSMHNGDMTGHGTAIMPAADWTFIPLAPRNRREGNVAALARPATGHTRDEANLAHLAQLMLLVGQAWDRTVLERERRERERLEQVDRLRRTFLASLAHDFRTPLTVVMGRLKDLAESVPDAREALEAAERLDRMMSDLLAAARLEEGSLMPALEVLDLIDVVSTASRAITLGQDRTLVREIAPDLPFVCGDPVLLHHVLVNLIDNALRHARSAIALTAHVQEDRVVLVVADDGPGVAPEDRDRIFERFTRLEGDDRSAGSGLGLAIVRGFAEAQGMTVTASAAPEGGAAFSLSMPRVRDGGPL